jgi:hypothetical protein
MDPRFPGRDLATGDLGEILGEQGAPLGAEQAPREELQHATQQHIPADQHAGGMLGLPIGGHLPANAARRLAGVIEVVAAGLASQLAAHPATAQLTGHQRTQRVAAARRGMPVQPGPRPRATSLLPQLHQLSPAAAAALQRHLAGSSECETARSLTTLGSEAFEAARDRLGVDVVGS